MIKTMVEQFQASRRASAPIVAISTPDPTSTIRDIRTVFTAEPTVQWNIVDGVTSMNSQSKVAVTQMHTVDGQLVPAPVITGNPVEAIRLCTLWLPAKSIVFMHNAHFYVEQNASDSHKPVVQAVWNTRDIWRNNERTLVLLAPSIQIPMEIRNDIMVIDENLPTDKDLAAIVVRGLSRAQGRKATKKQLDKLVDAVSGLASFNAETVVSMSVSPKTKRPDMDQVWQQKIKLIEQARGLKVYRHGANFSDIGGNDRVKALMTNIARGTKKPRLIVFMDEIEKSMQAAGMDTSGTTTDQLKVLLTSMQDNGWTGMIIYGFAGTGKSQLSKAFGNEAGCPTVEADLGAMKNMWVGSSEANMRSFIKVIKAMGQDRVFFLATCNGLAALPPEFQRRFRKGLWFCDLPAQPERNKIWDIYLKRFEIPVGTPRPNDEGWTGAEIELCCENSHEFGVSLVESAKFMTITSQAMGDKVEEMRKSAHGKYLDSQHSGHYQYRQPKKETFFTKLQGDK